MIFLIPLLSSSSAKISFSNTLLISKTFHFTAKISIALCQPIYLGTLKVLSLRLRVAGVKLCKLLEKIFPGRISPQPQECGVTLVTVTNEPVLRPSTLYLHFLGQNIFSFQLVRNIEGYRSGSKI